MLYRAVWQDRQNAREEWIQTKVVVLMGKFAVVRRGGSGIIGGDGGGDMVAHYKVVPIERSK